MKDILRDSVLGQFLNSVSGGRILPYSDQRKDFVVPERFRTDFLSRSGSRATIVGDSTPPDLKKIVSVEKSLSELPLPTYPQTALTSSAASTRTVVRDSTISAAETAIVDAAAKRLQQGGDVNLEDGNVGWEKHRDDLANVQLHPDQVQVQDSNLVGWYGPDDSDNPR